MVETVAKCLYVRSSAQKLRLAVDLVRGKSVIKALHILNYVNKKAAFLVHKTLKSAVANAEHNNGINIDNLKIVRIFVNDGPKMKRMMPRAKGRSDRIQKRTSHIIIVVSD